MGKLVEKSKKKKKGRPSLLDLQKRNLRHQKHLLNKHNNNLLTNNINIIINNNKNSTPKSPPNPNRRSRSTRRNPIPNPHDDGESEEEDGLEDADERKDFSPDENEEKSRKKRKIDSISRGSGAALAAIDDKLQVEKQSIAVTKQTNNEQGSNKQEDGYSTPLPDKKLLLFILDSLQTKDTYKVFAEPVDPEELPDYHEVIKHPMDFSTVQKKLEDDAYRNLEQFEKDIFLICSNAMQYNAPDTIYFRQAYSMHELARKNFENLRQDGDDSELEPESKVVRRGRPPTKHLKRPRGRPPLERTKSDFSEATLATAGGSTNRLNEHRKGPPHLEKYGSTDSFPHTLCGSRNSVAYVGRSAERSERSDDMIGSASKGYSMKHWKKQIVLDESRRTTYQNSYALSCRYEPSVLTTFHGERKQLIAVGLHTEHGYARSLARFTAKLGPVAWKVASKRIERCLPSSIKFGQGWVGENEALSERLLQQSPDASVQSSSGDRSELKPHTEQSSEMHMPSHHPKSKNKQNKAISNPENGRNLISVSSPSMLSNGSSSNLIAPESGACSSPSSMVNMLSNSTGLMRSGNKVQIHHASTIESCANGVIDSHGLKMIESQRTRPPSDGCGEAKLSASSSPIKMGDFSPNAGPHQKGGSAPPDLNVGFQSLESSPGSVMTDSVQPDLALQL